jgi:hypothetical protein
MGKNKKRIFKHLGNVAMAIISVSLMTSSALAGSSSGYQY